MEGEERRQGGACRWRVKKGGKGVQLEDEERRQGGAGGG